VCLQLDRAQICRGPEPRRRGDRCDAIGGGTLASQILAAMAIAALKAMPSDSRNASSVHKQF
jgi:hypothetical protein